MEGGVSSGAGGPVGAPVPEFQSTITEMYRDAPVWDAGAHLTGLETPRVFTQVEVLIHMIKISLSELAGGEKNSNKTTDKTNKQQ